MYLSNYDMEGKWRSLTDEDATIWSHRLAHTRQNFDAIGIRPVVAGKEIERVWLFELNLKA